MKSINEYNDGIVVENTLNEIKFGGENGAVQNCKLLWKWP
jgi:hypothetical protein